MRKVLPCLIVASIQMCATIVAFGAEPSPADRPAAQVKPVEFSFGKFKIGDTVTPEFKKEHWNADDEKKSIVYCIVTVEVEGHYVLQTFAFKDEKFVGAEISYEPIVFDTVVAGYAKKFGAEPHEKKTERLKTRIGAEYENEIITWKTNAGDFVLRKYNGTIENGDGALENDFYKQQNKAARESAVDDAKSKL